MEKLKAMLRASDKSLEFSNLEVEMNKPTHPVEGEENDK
jgi:hypothetical protein